MHYLIRSRPTNHKLMQLSQQKETGGQLQSKSTFGRIMPQGPGAGAGDGTGTGAGPMELNSI